MVAVGAAAARERAFSPPRAVMELSSGGVSSGGTGSSLSGPKLDAYGADLAERLQQAAAALAGALSSGARPAAVTSPGEPWGALLQVWMPRDLPDGSTVLCAQVRRASEGRRRSTARPQRRDDLSVAAIARRFSVVARARSRRCPPAARRRCPPWRSDRGVRLVIAGGGSARACAALPAPPP